MCVCVVCLLSLLCVCMCSLTCVFASLHLADITAHARTHTYAHTNTHTHTHTLSHTSTHKLTHIIQPLHVLEEDAHSMLHELTEMDYLSQIVFRGMCDI